MLPAQRRQASNSTTDAEPSRSAGSGRKLESPSAPADVSLAADACTLASLGGEDVWVADVLATPAQVGGQGAKLDGVVGIVRVGKGELPQGPEGCPEVGPDRIGPGRIGRSEAEFDLVPGGPATDPPVQMRRQVVEGHVYWRAVQAGCTDRPQCRSGVADVLAAAQLPRAGLVLQRCLP